MEKRLGWGLDLKYWKTTHSSLPLGGGFWGSFSCFYFPVFFTRWWGGFVWLGLVFVLFCFCFAFKIWHHLWNPKLPS